MKKNEEMKIIVFESAIDSLAAFAYQMAEGFRQAGCRVMLADMQNTGKTRQSVMEFAEKGRTAALFFNHTGLNLLTEDGQSIWNLLEADCYDYIVDHPMYYHAALIFPVERLTFVCVDEYHHKFIQRFYEKKVKSIFLPLAGMIASGPAMPFEDKDVDVIFTGSYNPEQNAEAYVSSFEEEAGMLWKEGYEWLLEHKERTVEEAVEQCFLKRGIKPDNLSLRNIIQMFRNIDGALRTQMRMNVVKALAESGMHLHVYGNGWEYFEGEKRNLTIYGRISFRESIEQMKRAKIVLNVMPWFKAGSHDRIYTAMLNHSVACTDASEYLSQTLTDRKNVLFYSIDNLDGLAEQLHKWLKQPELLKEIAEEGYHYAKIHHTWQNRALELLTWMRQE